MSTGLRGVVGLVLGIAVAVVSTACRNEAGPVQAAAVDPVERGRYLVQIMGCGDCHTPLKAGPSGPVPDESRALSGHPEGMVLGPAPTLDGGWMWTGAATNTAFAGPWGLSYAPNLTPDEESGMGMWTEEMFVEAMRTGKKFGGGRPIMPPMPWPAYAHATDDDLKAVFAYLRMVPPVVNHVPDSQPATMPAAR
jgi:hypothetical protein